MSWNTVWHRFTTRMAITILNLKKKQKKTGDYQLTNNFNIKFYHIFLVCIPFSMQAIGKRDYSKIS